MPGARASDSTLDQSALPQEPAPPPPSRHPLRRPERRSLSDSGLSDFRNVVSEASDLGGASARAARSARDAYAATAPSPPAPPPAEDLDRQEPTLERADPRMFEQREVQDRPPHQDFTEPMLEPTFTGDESRPAPPSRAQRRPPPPPIEDEAHEEFEGHQEVRPPRSYAGLIKAGIALAIVLLLAGVVAWQWSNMVALYSAFRKPTTEVVTREPPPSTQRKAQERIEPGATPQEGAGVTPGAAVAQKVVLYEEDPADPQGKRYVGSALWRTETVSPGPGQPPELAIRADVEVPERKLAMTWSLRRNTDKGLPASHTVEIMFKLPADFPAGGISNVPGILMKQAEQTRGVPLAGLAVKVTNGFFLIGLSAVDTDRDRNLSLLKERGWFDIPVVYTNNRRAILAMEKGTPGERAFAEAFKVWKQ
jgi:hypothetical protein